MPRETIHVPKCGLHKATGQARVTLDGRGHYLGQYGTAESRQRYEQLIATWISNHQVLPVQGGISPHLTVDELLLAYLRFAEGYYVKNGAPTSELACVKAAWRVADSLGLRRFLGYALTDDPPDHSTISRNRRLIDVEAHEAVFVWVLKVLAENGLLKGKTVGIDATSLEANAAMRSIVRRDSGESYQAFLARLAQESGIETLTREQLAKLDKKRKNKASNDDWESPHDPDAKITKMKDARTHLAHKAEHAVDMDSGAILAVTLQPADRGDTSSIEETLQVAADAIVELAADDKSAPQLSKHPLSEVVADKGYHSNAVLTGAAQMVTRTYLSEPDRGRRRWSGNEEARARSTRIGVASVEHAGNG